MSIWNTDLKTSISLSITERENRRMISSMAHGGTIRLEAELSGSYKRDEKERDERWDRNREKNHMVKYR